MRFRESVVYGVIEIAQAVITEAEPHRRRFPNFAVAFTCAAMAISGHTPASGPVRGRAAGVTALGPSFQTTQQLQVWAHPYWVEITSRTHGFG